MEDAVTINLEDVVQLPCGLIKELPIAETVLNCDMGY